MLWEMMEGMNSLGNLHKAQRLSLLEGQARGSKALPGILVLCCCKRTDGVVSPLATGTGMNFTRVP